MVAAILDRHGVPHQPPLDVVGLARVLGLAVYAHESLVAYGLSGVLEYVRGEPRIFVNPNESATRQRFTVAHELGHFHLDQGTQFRDNVFMCDDGSYDGTQGRSMEEVRANYFAAELLMHEAWLLRDLRRGYQSVEQLAVRYQVSRAAMDIRLSTLRRWGRLSIG